MREIVPTIRVVSHGFAVPLPRMDIILREKHK